MTKRPEVPQRAPSRTEGGVPAHPSTSDFQNLFDHLPDPAFILDKATLRFLAVNTTMVQRYGWSQEEFLGMTVVEIHPEHERETVLEHMKDLPPPREVNGGWHHQSKNGGEFLVDVIAKDFRYQGRDGRLVIVKDAFERNMAWAALRETQETYSNLVDNLSEGVAILDEEGRFLFVNAACGHIFGMEPEGLLGRIMLDMVAPEFRQRHARQIQTRGMERDESFELEILRPDGSLRWIAIREAPRTDSSGRFAGSVASFFDITQHRRALEALQQSEIRFRRLVEMLPQGLVTYQDGRITYSNPAASAITRTDPKEAVGRPILDYIHPSSWSAIRDRFARMLQGEDVPSMDYIFRRGDGTEVQVEAHAQILEGGDHPVMISVFTDLTRRLEMEQAIRISEERFRVLAEQTQLLVYDYDLAADRAVWAGPVELLLGQVPENFFSHASWDSHIHPEDRKMANEELVRCRESLLPYHVEYRIRKADGSYLWIEDHGIFIPGPDGSAARMLGTLHDISERYAAALALKESEELYRSVIEQAQEMIFLVDLDTMAIVQTNQAFHRILGYPQSLLPGLTLYDIVEADRGTVDSNIEAVKQRGSTAIGRRLYRHADGTTRQVEVTGSILRSGGRNLMVVLARDITERLATERALQQSQKLESLGILAGGIAHDFNNLLTAMMGNLSLAQLKSHASAPSWPYMDAIGKTLQRAADLTRQMLAYSGKGRFVTKVVDLNHTVEEMTHLLSVSISKNILLEFDFEKGLPPLEVDPAQLQQVVMNLVTNASDAIGDKAGTIRIATSLVDLSVDRITRDFPAQAIEPGPHLLLEVCDSGSGMDEETLQRIFEPFFTTKTQGRGLGLSAMLGILRGHRAGIRIISATGLGTSFFIYFPAKAGAVADTAAARANSTVVPVGGVLVVDDEPEIRDSIVEQFRILGFGMVFEASDGADALEIYKARRSEISLVFMDLTMPRMNGKEAYRTLRNMDPTLPIILTSGFNQEPDLEGDERPAAFLQKPFDFRQLRTMVMQTLQKQEGS